MSAEWIEVGHLITVSGFKYIHATVSKVCLCQKVKDVMLTEGMTC